MEKVTGNHQLVCLGALEKPGDASEIIEIIASGNGDPLGLKGGGFPQMDVGEDEGRRLGKKDRAFAQEVDFMSMVGDAHGANYPAKDSSEASIFSSREAESSP